MAELVYVLCTATSVLCAWLLFKGYLASRTRLLFFSSLCFVGLALNNVLLLVDLIALPMIDLSLLRSSIALAAMMVLLWGLVWESK